MRELKIYDVNMLDLTAASTRYASEINVSSLF